MPASAWTHERDQILRTLWGQSFTRTVIAREMGMSRNAISGRIFRLKLPYMPVPPKKLKPPRKFPTTIPAKIKQLKTVRKSPPLNPRTIDDATIPDSQRRALFDLEAKHCRYPLGEPGTASFSYCAGERMIKSRSDGSVFISPYCTPHHIRAHRPLEPRYAKR